MDHVNAAPGRRARCDLGHVRPAGSYEGSLAVFGEVVDQVPAGVGYIRLSLHALTSTVTALTAEFKLEDDRAQGLEGILNQEFATRVEVLPGRDPMISGVRFQKLLAVEKWRAHLRGEAARWLGKRFPGSFNRLAPGHLPAIEFLLTAQHRPWDPEVGPGTPGWAGMLDLSGSHGYWQCATIPSLRLQERRDSGRRPDQRHRLVLAAPEQEFIPADSPSEAGSTYDPPGPYFLLDVREPVTDPLARWSLTALIRELEEQLADLQDAADRASRRRSPRALAEIRRQLLQTGIDSRIVVNDIVRYAQHPGWKRNVLDFSEAPPPARQGQTEPAASLAEFLRQGQITDSQRVSQLENDLREVLSTSAQLTSARKTSAFSAWSYR